MALMMRMMTTTTVTLMVIISDDCWRCMVDIDDHSCHYPILMRIINMPFIAIHDPPRDFLPCTPLQSMTAELTHVELDGTFLTH